MHLLNTLCGRRRRALRTRTLQPLQPAGRSVVSREAAASAFEVEVRHGAEVPIGLERPALLKGRELAQHAAVRLEHALRRARIDGGLRCGRPSCGIAGPALQAIDCSYLVDTDLSSTAAKAEARR